MLLKVELEYSIYSCLCIFWYFVRSYKKVTMSNYPYDLDDDTDLPRVENNITQIGGEAINALRSAVFNIEEAIGTGAPGGLLQTIALTQFLLQNQPTDAAGYAFVAPFFLPNG